jgi:hypothetical protein
MTGAKKLTPVLLFLVSCTPVSTSSIISPDHVPVRSGTLVLLQPSEQSVTSKIARPT